MALRPAVPPPVPRAERTFSTFRPSSCQEQPGFLQNRVCWGSSPPPGRRGLLGLRGWWRCGCQDPCEVRWCLGRHIVSAGSPEASGGPGRPGGPEGPGPVRSRDLSRGPARRRRRRLRPAGELLLLTSRGRSRETPSGSSAAVSLTHPWGGLGGGGGVEPPTLGGWGGFRGAAHLSITCPCRVPLHRFRSAMF